LEVEEEEEEGFSESASSVVLPHVAEYFVKAFLAT
jgi:hypothetical protein